MNALLRLCFVELIGVCLVMAFINAPGTFDDYAFVQWAKTLNAAGPFAGYGVLSHRADLDYPPVGLVLMWLPIHLGQVFGVSDLVSFKAPIAIFTFLAGQVALLRKRRPDEALVLMLIAAPFGLVLGYTDVMYLPFLLAALYAGQAGKFGWAGLALAVASLIKWQPIILGPIFLVAAFRCRQSLRDFAWVLVPTAVLVLVVFLLFGPRIVFGVFLTATQEDYLSGQGANAAWLISYILEVLRWDGLGLQPDGAVAIIRAHFSMSAVGAVMGVLRVVFYGLFFGSVGIYAFGRKTTDGFLIGALACALSQFTWNTGVHENHLFVSMIVGFACWQAEIIDGFLFCGLAVISVLNILLFYGFDGSFNFTNFVGFDATVILAVGEMLLYFMVLDVQVRVSFGGWRGFAQLARPKDVAA